MRRPLPKIRSLGASQCVLESLLKLAGVGATHADVRVYAAELARIMESKGLAIAQTHVVTPDHPAPRERFIAAAPFFVMGGFTLLVLAFAVPIVLMMEHV